MKKKERYSTGLIRTATGVVILKTRGAPRSECAQRLPCLSPGGRSSKYAANDPSVKKKIIIGTDGETGGAETPAKTDAPRLSQFGNLDDERLCFSHGDALVGGGVTFYGAYHNCREEQLPRVYRLETRPACSSAYRAFGAASRLPTSAHLFPCA